MKRIILLLVFIYFTASGFSQITSFSVESSKDYDDNTRISYLYIEGVSNVNQADHIRDAMMKQPMVHRFTFYEKNVNFNKCMIQADKSLDEIYISNLINGILLDYQVNEKIINDILEEMPKYVDSGNSERDKEVYRFAVKEWIENNPEKYAILNQAGNILNPENPEKIAKDKLSE